MCWISVLKRLPLLLALLLASAGAAAAQEDSSENDRPKPTLSDTAKGQAAADPWKPYHFVSSGTLTIIPQDDYGAGSAKRWLLGDEYRDVWTSQLVVPVIDLGKTAGGLTPIERGGGLQTSSLHLEGGDGHFYVLRSVDKTAELSLPEGFRNTVVESVVQDQISSLNPVGSLILPPLERAAGILHRHPTLVVIPDSPELGEYREEYGGMLAQFERKPDEDQSEAARFGYSKNIVSSATLFEDLLEDNDDRVDERAFAKARLFDMLIGDWDRHDDQWRWAEFETEHGTRYVPVPRDRDFAFVKFDGFINKLGRNSGDMMLRRHVNFSGDIPDVLGLNWQGSKLDIRLTPSLDRSDWLELADSLRITLTDDVIDAAVRTWPDPVYERIGPTIAENLKSRRDRLQEAASRYYDLLAETVDVVGTNKHERFEITRLNDDETRVVMLKTKKEGDVVRELMSRVFLHDETDEIRLYGLGGNDQFVIRGKADRGILIRMIGGEGDDAIVDSSTFGGPARLARFYDMVEGTGVEAGSGTRVRLSTDPRINNYEQRRFELHTVSPVASVDYNSDDGVFIGGGVRIVRAGFRKDPYAARHVMTLNYAPRSSAFNAYYDGRLVRLWNRFDGRLTADALAARTYRNFYGLGNETSKDDRGLFLAELQTVTVVPSLRRDFRNGSFVEFGPRAEFISVDPPEGLEVGDPGVGYTADQLTDKYFAGFQSTIVLDGRDDVLNARSGFYWSASSSLNLGIRTSDQRFGRIESELRTYYTLPLLSQITVGLRAGGATIIGSFPFFEASTLGARDNLRGYPRRRFSGRSAAYVNADLRAKLFDFNAYLVKGGFGVLGFIDQGRVWIDDDDSNVWHRGYGGGIWMTPFEITVLTASVGYSDEGGLFDLSVGFQF